jgi:Domain of unknown function (DUF4160)
VRRVENTTGAGVSGRTRWRRAGNALPYNNRLTVYTRGYILSLVSPTVFRQDGYRFSFFSLEEDRVHVHVYSGDGEAKYWLEPKTELATSYRLNRKQLRDIERILEERKDEIIERWKQHHGNR